MLKYHSGEYWKRPATGSSSRCGQCAAGTSELLEALEQRVTTTLPIAEGPPTEFGFEQVLCPASRLPTIPTPAA